MPMFIQDLMSLFEGFHHAYGFYSGDLTPDATGKRTGRRASIQAEVTVELWQKHVTGTQGLGIIPINENSDVKFAAIDIDEYDLDLMKMNQVIQKKRLPVVLCRSKSGGAHIYLFLTRFMSARVVQQKMREIASLLGYGNAEIFPKQTQINAERGDVGNWINVPYFRAARSERWGMNAEGKKLEVEEFCLYAKTMLVNPNSLKDISFDEEQLLPGAPPCLNHLAGAGFPKGTRNSGLLNLGVYAKKFQPDGWEVFIEEYNRRFMDPPLDSVEVLGIIKSLRNKDFFYTCKQSPIVNYCNMPKCRTCKHGIGQGNHGMPKMGTLTKLKTNPAIWFIELEGGGRLELSTHQLQNQRAFQTRCMETLNVMPIPPKNEVWQEIVSELLDNCNELTVPEENTPPGMLKQHLEDFCTGRVQAKNPEEMILGKPWTNNHFHYFRMSDFTEYLERRKFFDIPKNYIYMYMRDWGCKTRFFNIKGKGFATHYIKEFEKQEVSFDVPETTKQEPY